MENTNANQAPKLEAFRVAKKELAMKAIYHSHDLLTRDQAIAKAGEATVLAAEQDNCEPTSRLMPAGAEDVQEWAGQASGGEWHVRALYYPTAEEIESAGDDLSNVDWRIEGYTVR